MLTKILLLNLCLLVSFSPILAYAEQEKKNKLVAFKGFNEWEVWCIDKAQSGNVICDLNQVLKYKDHPDFRAMIVHFYVSNGEIERMVINREWQTSFSKAFIQVDNQPPISLSNCAKPCEIKGDNLAIVKKQFSSGKKANIRIHDYLIEVFDVDIDLGSYAKGLEALLQMQKQY